MRKPRGPRGNTPDPGAPKPAQPNRSGVPLHVWIDPAVRDRFKKFIDAQRFPIPQNSVVEKALDDFLKKEGF